MGKNNNKSTCIKDKKEKERERGRERGESRNKYIYMYSKYLCDYVVNSLNTHIILYLVVRASWFIDWSYQ